MRTDLLLRLADLLVADANNPTGVKFDLSHWGTTAEHAEAIAANVLPWEDIQAKRFNEDVTTIPVDCNTAACAMGLAAITGAFKDEGLTWELMQRRNGTGELIPSVDGTVGFGAAMKLFDIDENAATGLFDPLRYDLTKGKDAELAVAERIRNYVNGTWSPIIDDDDDDDE